MIRQLPDHPEIECALRTGYPSWIHDRDEDGDEDDCCDDDDELEDYCDEE